MPSITALQGELGRAIFLLLVVGTLAVLCLAVTALRRRGARRTAALVARTALAVVLVGVASLTLVGVTGIGQAPRMLILDPVEGAMGWGRIAWRPVVDNVALFVPVGAVATAVWWRRSPALVWFGCVLLSAGIETLQFLVPMGRVANMADLLANALGALLGVVLAVSLGVRRVPAQRSLDRTSTPNPSAVRRSR
ncbi:MAG: VanZ family protein [Nitriliruptoraceae bacterium]|nr:VanZ family protein [Nitriliruptoraceae bacterium]